MVKEPAAHWVQAPDLAADVAPAPHAEQAAELAAAYVPAEQVEQVVAEAAEYVPAEQVAHESHEMNPAELTRYVPAAHAVQLCAPIQE